MKKKDGVVVLGAAAVLALAGIVQAQDFGGGYDPSQNPGQQDDAGQYEPIQDTGDQVEVQDSGDQDAGQYVDDVSQNVGPDQMLGSGSGAPDVPVNAKPGECYSRCIAPAKYKNVTEKVLVKPATERIETIPARYRTVEKRIVAKDASERIETTPPKFAWRTERIVLRPASERLRAIPAKYETRQEQVVVKPGSTRIVTTPPVFKTERSRVLVQAASTKWVRMATPCTDDDVKLGLTDCETLCLVESPAMYKTVIKKVLVEPAREQTVTIPAEFETVTRDVVVSPARVEREVIPAEYQTVRKKVMVEPAKTSKIPVPAEYKTIRVKEVVQEASERRVPVPAEYQTITKRVKVSDSKIVWRSVLCEDQIKDTKIISVQKSLSQEGFYSGAVDGNFNTETQQAVRAYQRSKGLPEGGGLTIETLEAMGIYE
uniref:peptidoglycan-binding domain-containing protein n=1 Tax=Candidatus Electronema sp. TaxID=2698783 RepID=UPI004055DCCC